MPRPQPPRVGAIVWRDLTVTDAPALRDFYRSVIGWKAAPVDMGGYTDFEMKLSSTNETVAGICHARGANAKIPPQWLVYVQVKDVTKSARQAAASGGTILDGPRPMGAALFCVIRDPAGAVLALIGPPVKRRGGERAAAAAADKGRGTRTRAGRRATRPPSRRPAPEEGDRGATRRRRR